MPGILLDPTPGAEPVRLRRTKVAAARLFAWALIVALASTPSLANESEDAPEGWATQSDRPPGADSELRPSSARNDGETEADREADPEARAEADSESALALDSGTEIDDAGQGEGEDDPGPAVLEILGSRIEPGTRHQLFLRITESFVGALIETPILVAAGTEPGPTLCVVAGIHGDEINGVEIVRRMMLDLEEENLRGVVIAVPIANLAAFRRGSRYLPDRRDLNRYFPGRAFGSSASRIAYGLFTEVIMHCDALVDLHTGSFYRTNLHQLRANLTDEATEALAHDYGAEVIVNSMGRPGTLRRAAMDAGIPAVTVEAGEPSRFDRSQVEHALEGLDRLLAARGMLMGDSMRATHSPSTAYLRTSWVRCDQGGILVSQVQVGDQVTSGQVLGTISDPLSGEVESIVTPFSGRVIGMALDQLVMPGFAAYHIGLNPRSLGAPPETVIQSTPTGEAPFEDPEGLELEERPE